MVARAFRLSFVVVFFAMAGLVTTLLVVVAAAVTTTPAARWAAVDGTSDERSAYAVHRARTPWTDTVYANVLHRPMLETEARVRNEMLAVHGERSSRVRVQRSAQGWDWRDAGISSEPLVLIDADEDVRLARRMTPSWFTVPDARDLRWGWDGSGEAMGWPMRAVWYGSRDGEHISPHHFKDELHTDRWVETAFDRLRWLPRVWLIELDLKPASSPRRTDVRYFPLRPLWFGIFVNSVLFGVMWWSLVRTPAWLMRSYRAARGLCARCGWNRLDTPEGPCPECGCVPRVPRALAIRAGRWVLVALRFASVTALCLVMGFATHAALAVRTAPTSPGFGVTREIFQPNALWENGASAEFWKRERKGWMWRRFVRGYVAESRHNRIQRSLALRWELSPEAPPDWISAIGDVEGDVDVFIAGWPMPCVIGFEHTDWRKTSLFATTPLAEGMLVRSTPAGRVMYPYRPLWGGVAVNTLVWAAPWVAVWIAWSRIRRPRRRGWAASAQATGSSI